MSHTLLSNTVFFHRLGGKNVALPRQSSHRFGNLMVDDRGQIQRRRECQPLHAGVNEARAGEILDGGALLEVLDVFGEEGVRSYLLGYVEGIVDVMEDE